MMQEKLCQAADIYGISQWANQHFRINSNGDVQVCYQQQHLELDQIVDRCRSEGLKTPVLLRFPHILEQQVQQLHKAFEANKMLLNYPGDYRVIYPIKVNQQRSVVETIHEQGAGLEAGSKAELLAILGSIKSLSAPIVCNGYKDAEYVELALLALRLGLNITLVIEKVDELDLILSLAQKLNIQPQLGMRLRLRSIGYGKWQNTGGAKAKFGLNAKQLLFLIESLKQSNQLNCLKLLHFHMGSQISNIRDIQTGLQEATRFLVDSYHLGANIEVMDVGGGLAIDYEGANTRSTYSMNYDFNQYAHTILHTVLSACQDANVPAPEIWSESGRALTAHHAVLITEVHSINRRNTTPLPAEIETDDSKALYAMRQLLAAINLKAPEEFHYELEYLLSEGHTQFLQGLLSLSEWAELEHLYGVCCLKLLPELSSEIRAQQSILDELEEQFADKLFLNFSVFRSIPDSWAIDQLFPIMPLNGLNKVCSQQAVIEDLTCDSDGRVDRFVHQNGIFSTLSVPDYPLDAHPYMGVFLVGAYQEVLGDNHNLFGLPHAVNIRMDGEQFDITLIEQGDTRSSVLQQVGFLPENLNKNFNQLLAQSDIPASEQAQWKQILNQALNAYTYLDCNKRDRSP